MIASTNPLHAGIDARCGFGKASSDSGEKRLISSLFSRPLSRGLPTIQSMRFVIPFLIVALLPVKASAFCFDEAASHYHVPAKLLQAISHVESKGDAKAFNRNKDGSFDISHMQINSRWLPKLAKFGITAERLQEPCVATYVGAWIVAQNIARYGYTWKAIGAYNSSRPVQQARYIQLVADVLRDQNRKS